MTFFDLFFGTHNCSICCEDITIIDKSCKTKCKHYFHYQCLNKWSQQLLMKNSSLNCPLCRTDLAK